MQRTLRSKRLRTALYIGAKGRCSSCGTELLHGWHADHVVPWSRRPITNVHEMQPMCPTCNCRKGDLLFKTEDLRPNQQQIQLHTQKMLDKLAAGIPTDPDERTIAIGSFPGTGKSKGYMVALGQLFAAGAIQRALVLTPRESLCKQVRGGVRVAEVGTRSA